MGLFKEILLLPLAPVRAPVVGVVKLAEIIQEQADQQLHNPANIHRELEDLEERRRRGEISAEEEREGQEAILARKVAPKRIADELDSNDEQSDQPPVTSAENNAAEQSDGDQRRTATKKSIRRSSTPVRRRSGVSRNQRRRRSV